MNFYIYSAAAALPLVQNYLISCLQSQKQLHTFKDNDLLDTVFSPASIAATPKAKRLLQGLIGQSSEVVQFNVAQFSQDAYQQVGSILNGSTFAKDK